MGDTGLVRFPVTLDPRAQEFIPTTNHHLPLFPDIYIPYPPPPPPPPHPLELLLLPADPTTVLGYPPPPPPHMPVPPHPYIRPGCNSDPPLPPPTLPPPSTTPSRTLLLSSVPTDSSESTVRRELEVFGDVRAVQMERVREGIVTVHFYDIRHAQAALVEIQEQHMQHQCRLRNYFQSLNSSSSLFNVPPPLPPLAHGLISGRAVWAQFMIPVTVGYPEGYNQGTLVLFNVDTHVPNNYLKDIFQAFGSVKEVRETPFKRHQRFIEFYDTREAARALIEMNGKEINGKPLVIEFSRPGGHNKRFSKSWQSNEHSKQLNFMPNYTTATTAQRCLVSSSAYHHVNNISRSNNAVGVKQKMNGGGVIQSAMASLRFNGVEGSNYRGVVNKNNNSAKKTSSTTSASVNVSSSGLTKKKQVNKVISRNYSKEYDPRFLIKEDAIMVSTNCSDTRTTVMIKNIPNKYSQKLLLNMLDNHCIRWNEQIARGDEDQPLSSYDFLYLPIDFVNKCNVGYGFVNMTSPEATLRLYKSFHLQNWEVFNSRKICQVTYARLQGVEALKEHFRSSKFPSEAEEYMPVVFTPPRDGRRLTPPVPIISAFNITSSKEEEEEEAYYTSEGGESIINDEDEDDVTKEEDT